MRKVKKKQINFEKLSILRMKQEASMSEAVIINRYVLVQSA